MELITFAIAAGETKRFERAGRYLEIIAADAALNVNFTGPQGERGADMRGALSGMYAELRFAGFEVSSVLAQTITLMVTDGVGGSRRQPGVVQVVDTARALVRADSEFFVAGGVVGGAAQFGQIAFQNLSTTRGCALKGVTLSVNTAQDIRIGSFNGTMTNTYTFTPQSKLVTAGQVATDFTDLLFRASSVGAVADPMQGRVDNFGGVYVPANTLVKLPLAGGPFLLAPGTGLVFGCNTAATLFNAAFEGETFPWV